MRRTFRCEELEQDDKRRHRQRRKKQKGNVPRMRITYDKEAGRVTYQTLIPEQDKKEEE